MKITDEARGIMAQDSQYFSKGVHKVKITKAGRGNSASGKSRLEITVTDGSAEGTAYLYLSEKAYPYSFKTVRAILVHNAQSEEGKVKARKYIDDLDDTDKLDPAKLVGKECWYKVEWRGETYQNAQGETKKSYERNVFGYEPKMAEPIAEPVTGATTDDSIDLSEIPFK